MINQIIQNIENFRKEVLDALCCSENNQREQTNEEGSSSPVLQIGRGKLRSSYDENGSPVIGTPIEGIIGCRERRQCNIQMARNDLDGVGR